MTELSFWIECSMHGSYKRTLSSLWLNLWIIISLSIQLNSFLNVELKWINRSFSKINFYLQRNLMTHLTEQKSRWWYRKKRKSDSVYSQYSRIFFEIWHFLIEQTSNPHSCTIRPFDWCLLEDPRFQLFDFRYRCLLIITQSIEKKCSYNLIRFW